MRSSRTDVWMPALAGSGAGRAGGGIARVYRQPFPRRKPVAAFERHRVDGCSVDRTTCGYSSGCAAA
jgi:hypothetical protein